MGTTFQEMVEAARATIGPELQAFMAEQRAKAAKVQAEADELTQGMTKKDLAELLASTDYAVKIGAQDEGRSFRSYYRTFTRSELAVKVLNRYQAA